MTIQLIPIIVIFVNVVLAVFVFSQNPKAISNRLFALLASLGAIWNFANLMTDVLVSVKWLQASYALGALVIATGLTWVLLMTDEKFNRRKISLIYIVAIFFSVFSFQNGFIITHFAQTNHETIYAGNPGVGLVFYALFYIGGTLLILLKLYKSITQTDQQERKHQLKYVFVGATITLLLTAFSSFILPHYFSIFLFSSLDSIGFLIFLLFITYSITRHHLFNIRLIAVQIVTFALWIFILIRTILAENTRDLFIQSSLLTLTVIFGIMLIRGVLREIQQREKIEKLAGELQTLNSTLEAKVAEQTVEIRRAYEVEKKARMELEKLNDAKDQFIMITQHHLRTPVTGIIWQIESILENVYGKVSGKLEGAVLTMKTSADRLMTIINDFLNITAIKSGTNILNLTVKSLKPALLDVLDEIKLEIDRMKVTVTYPEDGTSWPEVKADHPKMREVLLIVIENAVRYNHEGGTVDITTDTKDGMFTMTIENTGIGITSEEHEKIGTSLFYRGQRARESHAIGMGVGLSVVKAMMKAHHGTFSIESRGEGRGARVVVGVA